MTHSPAFKKTISCSINGGYLWLHVCQFALRYATDSRAHMMVRADMAPGLVCDLRHSELVLAVQLLKVPRYDFL